MLFYLGYTPIISTSTEEMTMNLQIQAQPKSQKAVFIARDVEQSLMHFADHINKPQPKKCAWSHVEKNRSCK